MDVNSRLIVGGSGEDLALLGRDRGVSLDQLGGYSAQCLDGQRQRSYIQQQHVVNLARQYAGLNGSADSYALIRVDALERILAGNLLNGFLYGRDSGGTADEDNLGNIGVGNAGVSHGLSHRFDRSLYQMLGELNEFGSGQIHVHVQRAVSRYGDERQVDVGGLRAGKLFLGFFCSFFESLQRHLVGSEIYAVFFGEVVSQIVHDHVVEIVAAQVGVADGHVERAAAQVIDEDLVGALFLVEAVGQRGGRRLVDDSLYVQSGDSAGVLGGLLLRVGEVSRYGDYRFGDFLAQIAFGVIFELGEDHRGNILRRVILAVDGYFIVFSHVSLDGGNSSVRVGDCLSLGRLADQSLSVLLESHYRRSGSHTFSVRYNSRFAAFEHSDTRVGCS